MFVLQLSEPQNNCSGVPIRIRTNPETRVGSCRPTKNSVDRSLDLSIDRSVARSLDRWIARSIARSLDRSNTRSLDRSIARWIARTLDRSITWTYGCRTWAIVYDLVPMSVGHHGTLKVVLKVLDGRAVFHAKLQSLSWPTPSKKPWSPQEGLPQARLWLAHLIFDSSPLVIP